MMAELPSVSFEYTVICDDVRREHNNKLILIGLYANNIVLNNFPANLRLHLVSRLKPKKSECTLSFRVSVNGDAILIFRAQLTSPELDADTISSPEFLVPLERAGTITVDASDEPFELSDERTANWVEIFSIPVVPASAS